MVKHNFANLYCSTGRLNIFSIFLLLVFWEELLVVKPPSSTVSSLVLTHNHFTTAWPCKHKENVCMDYKYNFLQTDIMIHDMSNPSQRRSDWPINNHAHLWNVPPTLYLDSGPIQLSTVLGSNTSWNKWTRLYKVVMFGGTENRGWTDGQTDMKSRTMDTLDIWWREDDPLCMALSLSVSPSSPDGYGSTL